MSKKNDRIVQIAWLLSDETGHVLSEENHFIIPDGFTIPAAATRVHGITTQKAKTDGQHLKFVLRRFVRDVAKCDALVAHNIQFDMGILRPELARVQLDCKLDEKLHFCTMRLSTAWCKIPKLNGSGGSSGRNLKSYTIACLATILTMRMMPYLTLRPQSEAFFN